jgi:hypothetical protein
VEDRHRIDLGLMAILFGGIPAAIIAATIQGGAFWVFILITLGVFRASFYCDCIGYPSRPPPGTQEARDNN